MCEILSAYVCVCRDSGSHINAAVKEYLLSEKKYRADVSLAVEKALMGSNGYPSGFSVEDSIEPILNYYDERQNELQIETRSCWRKAADHLQQVVDSSDRVITTLLDVQVLMDSGCTDEDRSIILEWCQQLQITRGTEIFRIM